MKEYLLMGAEFLAVFCLTGIIICFMYVVM